MTLYFWLDGIQPNLLGSPPIYRGSNPLDIKSYPHHCSTVETHGTRGTLNFYKPIFYNLIVFKNDIVWFNIVEYCDPPWITQDVPNPPCVCVIWARTCIKPHTLSNMCCYLNVQLYIHNKCTKMHSEYWSIRIKWLKYKDACSTTCDPCFSMLSTRKHLRSPVVGENIVWRYFTIKLRSICGDVLRYLTKRLQKFNEIVSNINASFQTSWSERRKGRQER